MLLGKVISQWSLRGHHYAHSDQFPTGRALKLEKRMAGPEAISFKSQKHFSAIGFPSHFQGETKRKKRKKKRRGRDSDWIVSQFQFLDIFSAFHRLESVIRLILSHTKAWSLPGIGLKCEEEQEALPSLRRSCLVSGVDLLSFILASTSYCLDTVFNHSVLWFSQL